jgi:hypothetical protein
MQFSVFYDAISEGLNNRAKFGLRMFKSIKDICIRRSNMITTVFFDSFGIHIFNIGNAQKPKDIVMLIVAFTLFC